MLEIPFAPTTAALNGTHSTSSPISSLDSIAAPAGSSLSQTQIASTHSPAADASLQDFVFICGYGRVGQLVCEMLDRKCIPYVVLENNPQRAREARSRGLPVYYGRILIAFVMVAESSWHIVCSWLNFTCVACPDRY